MRRPDASALGFLAYRMLWLTWASRLWNFNRAMNRWVWFFGCVILGLLALGFGWLVPAHLRAVDSAVLERAGRKTPSLAERGLQLLREGKLGPAEMVCRTVQEQRLPGRETLATSVTNLVTAHPGWQAWGGGERHLEILFGAEGTSSETVIDWLLRTQNREKTLELLRASRRATTLELLRCRGLTNTQTFSPSQTSSGQAFDAVLALAGLLVDEDKMSSGLGNDFRKAAEQANGGGGTQLVEEMLLDLMSLGQRLDWAQLAELVGPIENADTLRQVAGFARRNEAQLPALFSAVELSGSAAAVCKYLADFSQTGMKDVTESLRFHAGGLNELLKRHEPLYFSSLRRQVTGAAPWAAMFSVAVDCCWRAPGLAIAIKWLLYLMSGFLLAAAMHFGRPAVSVLEQPLQVRGFHVAREFLFALGFLLVVLLLSEPFLARESQPRAEFRFRLRLPVAGGTVPAKTGDIKQRFMNENSLLTLLLFFVLQGLLYIACLVKLAEIRRQRVPARIKLKLLENEDHLFDAGLYLGFVGTIISLILFSLGVLKMSLMAAYSSTSFGIIFVSVFKIFHLRPTRRKLLLESETGSAEPMPASSMVRIATPS